MLIYFLVIIGFIITLLPFSWSLYKLYKEKDYIEIIIHIAFFTCITMHGYMFTRHYYYQNLDTWWINAVQSLVATSFIPLFYLLISRRMGALYTRDICTLIWLGVIGFIVRGNINLGFEECQMDSCDLEPFQIGIYFNKDLIVALSSYEIAMLLQTFFSIYKSIVLFWKMKKKRYHFSKKFKWMQLYIAITLILILSSFTFTTEDMTNKHFMITMFLIGSVIINIGYLLTVQNYSVAPLEDSNNEPVFIITPQRFSHLAEKFKILVEKDKIYTTENLHMEDVAKMLGTNRTYVSLMMKEEFGTSFSAYMNRCRVEEAKRILLEDGNEEKLQNVAWQSGFNSLSSFNKVFKGFTGVTPSEWVKTVHSS